MAGSPKASRSKYTRASWQGFVERRLSDEELAELDEWQPSAMDVFSALDSALADGYRVTLSYNPTTSLATCTLMDDDKKRKSGGYALSTSDRDCSLALKAAMFKFVYVLEKSLESLVDQPSAGGRRG